MPSRHIQCDKDRSLSSLSWNNFHVKFFMEKEIMKLLDTNKFQFSDFETFRISPSSIIKQKKSE